MTIIGLGPGDEDLLTVSTLSAIQAVTTQFVRTTRHPAARALATATSFDHHYETLDTIDAVYAAIVEDLVVAATGHGEVLYAVPGSPAVAERTVELLRADPRVDVVVLPALSCVDLAWVRLGVDPLADGARVIDGHRFAAEAAGERGPLLVLQCDRPDVLADIKLSIDPGHEPCAVTVLQRLGLPDERIVTISWNELDRQEADHLTSLWIPVGAPAVGRELVGFAELVRTLRARCPWDAEQTHASLRRYLLEEAYETLEAIDHLDERGSEELEEELGDLLFQIYFHATLAAEAGEFTLADVARGIHDKLVRRHPHVFPPDGGSPDGSPSGTSPYDWEAMKQAQKGRVSALDGIPPAVPALLLADKTQRRAAGVGFDWADVDGAWPKVIEEIAEVRAAGPGEVEGEIGDLLFACVNVARHLHVDPEAALRAATAKFGRRFREVERLATAQGDDVRALDLGELDVLWEAAKAAEA
ncbi:MAG: nucleoside triphosphate pyrophosphohydrolase [Acidimicrobiales bacterium]